MGLKMWNGEAMCNVSWARPQLGADAYLYCPGPSLAEVQDAQIHRPGAMSFGLNTAYPHVRPDVWIGMDYPDCYDHRLWGEGIRKICRLGRHDEEVNGAPIKAYPEVFAATTQRDVNMEYVFENLDGNPPFAWFNHTFGVALHMMLWMGAKRIHFVGCDMGGKRDYYDDRVLSDENRAINRRLYGKIGNGFMSAFIRVGKKYGVECVSCTPGSPLNEKMEYVPLEQALQASEKRAPQPSVGVRDCRDITRDRLLCSDSGVLEKRGIVTACDREYEWLLPWWLQNLRKWCDLPVCVVDIGLTDSMRTWLMARPQTTHVVRFEGPPLQPKAMCKSFGLRFGWKPFCGIKSPFEEFMFIDADCEVVGPVEPAFDSLAEHDFAIADDQLFHHLDCAKHLEPGETMIQSGVWLARQGSDILKMWAEACMRGEDDWRINDQPVLSKVCWQNPELVGKLPAAYNVLAPVKPGWEQMVGSVTSTPRILHRLTSHPASKAALRQMAEDMHEVGGIWIENAAIMERCQWAHPPVAERGVVIGVDENQQWMLPWWLRNYAKHNRYPVMVADFGMNAEGRKWCEEQGLTVSPRIALDGAGWFKKPLGCLHTVFRRTVWLDTDVQVKGDMTPLFEYDGLAATVDRGTPQKWKDALPAGATVYNTGCLSFEWGDRVIQKWAQIVLLMKDLKPQEGRLLIPTGDQECFAMAVRRYGQVQEMPPEHHALRLGGDTDESILKHWTGSDGKKEIKRQMAGGQPMGRQQLLGMLPHGGVVAEVGVKEGHFSTQIRAICKPKELHLIDPWKHFDEGYDDMNNVAQNIQDKRYAVARLNNPSATFHRVTSEAAAERFEDGKFDWVYIDGNHDYEFVMRDLQMYAPKVKRGGFLCGHDYCTRPEAQGVKRAVDEFAEKNGWEMVYCTTDKWPSFALKRKGE